MAQKQVLAQMVRTSWTGRNGAPQDIQALAQTPDGTLWIGSTGGLYSFNGRDFAAFQPPAGDRPFPSNAIRSLFVARNGDLWVEGSFVGAARLSRGHLATVGDPSIRLFQIRQDSDGIIWAVRNYSQLVTLGDDSNWHPTMNPLPRPGYVSSLFIDSSGTQWVVEDGRLYKRSRGQAQFSATEVSTDGVAGFAEDKANHLWVQGNRLTFGAEHRVGRLFELNASGDLLQAPTVKDQIRDILAPGDGTLWFASPKQGILRLPIEHATVTPPPHGDDAKASPAADTLFTNSASTLLRDTDGDIWAGGLRGLDRFQHASIVALTKEANTGNWSTCTNPQGEVWVVSDNSPLSVLQNGPPVPVQTADGYSKLFCSTTGDVWFLDRLGIGVIHQHQFHQLPRLPAHKDYGSLYSFISFVDTADQGLLASMGSASERALWKFKDGIWKPFAPSIFTGFAHALLRNGEQIHVGRTDGKVFVFRERDASLLREQATDLGVISAFCPSAYGLFVVGANGIAIERPDGFHDLLFARPELALTVTGLQESTAGDVWINGARGIVRIPAAEIRKALATPAHAIDATAWTEGDYIGPASFDNATASVATDSTGQLWFSTLNGVVSLQSDGQPRTSQMPRIAIISVTGDDQTLTSQDSFPAHLQTLNVRYFGINLAHPDKVVYRYRLDGIESDWQNVGTRTEAIYTRLKPGRYTFQVSSSNGDNIWANPSASVSFRVLPAFYQTLWFFALCVVVLALLVWALFTLRLRAASQTITALAEERANERVRIARDLHDTLLQGVQGLMLSFHVAAEQLPQHDDSRRLLDRALSTADELMIEGRDRVSNLRAERFTHAGLLNAIRVLAIDLGQSTQITCRVSSKGIARDLPTAAAGQVFFIAREALTNAFRHANASHINLELRYSPGEFVLACRDNGDGFDPQFFFASHAKGHWGIRGMTERALEVGGKVQWLTPADGGTLVMFSLRRSRWTRFLNK